MAVSDGVSFDLLGAAEPLMKRYYDDRRVYSMAYKNRPLFAWIPKKTGVVGGSPFGNANGGYQVPVTIDDIAGESATFADAVTARDGDSHEVWQLNRVKRYGTATLDWETVRAMKNDMGAFMRAVTPRIDSAINQLSNSLAYYMYQDGTGVRGQLKGTGGVAGNTLTLTEASSYQARALGLRRTIVSSSTATGGTVDGSTGAKITGIVLDNGSNEAEITVDSATGFANGHYLFVLGDYTASGATQKVNDGVGSWGPDPTGITLGNPFKGVDRAKWKEKLLMLHFDASTGNIDENVRVAAAELQANEGSPDALFLNPSKWAALETALASQSRYEMMMGSDARTGFDSIVINAGGGKINVVADPWCPPDQGFMLQRNTWEMFSIDRFPDFVSDDGNRLHRLENADEVEFRLGGYYNVACRAPGHNMVLNFT